jgi:hypothetical protein
VLDIDADTRFSVAIDGAPVGDVGPGRTRLIDVRAGRRELAASSDTMAPFTSAVDVSAARAAALRIEGVPRVPATAALAHDLAFYGGVGIVAAGVVFGVVGTVLGSSASTFCVGSDPSCDATYVRTGSEPGSGVAVLPAAATATFAGVVLAGGSLLEPPTRPPWWSIAAAVVTGVLTAVLFAAAG